MKQKNRILLLISNIPDVPKIREVYPPERQTEISLCSNERVRAEKYYAWNTLLLGLRDYLGDGASDVEFYKKSNGKWYCDKCCFSISHSDGALAVAISGGNVGVDIESVKRHRAGIEKIIFSERELGELMCVDEDEREAFIIKKWTQKESVFKTLDKDRFVPSTVDPTRFSVWTERIALSDNDFFVSVCADDVSCIKMNLLNIK